VTVPHIKFLRDYTVQDETGTTYRKDEVVECSDHSAEHFIARNAAVMCDKPKPKPKPKAKEAKDDASED
jgi:hypothetical protein